MGIENSMVKVRVRTPETQQERPIKPVPVPAAPQPTTVCNAAPELLDRLDRAEAMVKKLNIRESVLDTELCEYCLGAADHKHSNGRGCCGGCCGMHGSLRSDTYEYKWVRQIVDAHNEHAKYLQSLIAEGFFDENGRLTGLCGWKNTRAEQAEQLRKAG